MSRKQFIRILVMLLSVAVLSPVLYWCTYYAVLIGWGIATFEDD